MKKTTVENNEPPIIYHPEALTPWRKVFEWSIATFGWLLWVFIIRPLIILCLWGLGFQFFYKHMIQLQGLMGLNELLISYVILICCIVCTVFGWHYYNRIRFRSKLSRRKTQTNVTPSEVASFFHMDNNKIIHLFQKSHVDIDFDKEYAISIKYTNDDGQSDEIQGTFRSS